MQIILINSTTKNIEENIFWGKSVFFKNTLDFNEVIAEQYLMSKNLDEEKMSQYINEFIELYQLHLVTEENQQYFNKSISFIHKMYDISEKEIYNYLIMKIEDFKCKENFEIFHYFKNFEFLYNGYNNIFIEILNWLSYNNKAIEQLLTENKSYNKSHSTVWINNHTMIMGNSGKGKSCYLKNQMLKKINKNSMVIGNKKISLEEFKEEDKQYFYNLMINLTKQKTINNLRIMIDENKDNIDFIGISNYIYKKLNYEYLELTLNQLNRNNENIKEKIIKI